MAVLRYLHGFWKGVAAFLSLLRLVVFGTRRTWLKRLWLHSVIDRRAGRKWAWHSPSSSLVPVRTGVRPQHANVGAGRHLIVTQHGFLGDASAMDFLVKRCRDAFGQSAIVVNSHENEHEMSFDGIPNGGERLFRLISTTLEANPQVERLSLVGYSLGGLYQRFAVGRLWEEGVLDRVSAGVFATLATPHLGARHPPATKFSVWRNEFGRDFAATTRELLMEDGDQPLLAQMTEPRSAFMQGLAKFERRLTYANVKSDNTVAYPTSSIQPRNVFRTDKGKQVLQTHARMQGQKYPHVMHIHRRSQAAKFQRMVRDGQLDADDGWSVFSSAADDDVDVDLHGDWLNRFYVRDAHGPLLRKMFVSLDSVGWERVDVRIDAYHTHGHIVVRAPALDQRGVDVIEHLVDQLEWE